MSKLDIFKLEWIDLVFAGRNKAYGAYELRKENPKTTSRALLVGSLLFIAVVTLPLIITILYLVAAISLRKNWFKDSPKIV